MIWSKYNFLFNKEGKYFIYSALSNFFAEIPIEYYNECKECESTNNIEPLLSDDFKEILIRKKVLVNSDEDEINRMIMQQNFRMYDNSYMNLTIAPTQYCNFDCVYCYEDFRKKEFIDDSTCDNIIKMAKSQKHLKNLHVCWYGGEPLLAINSIKKLSVEFLELDLNYSAEIITNAYLLNETYLNDLINCNVSKIQITIDGMKDTHDKRRALNSGKGSFDRILENLDIYMSKGFDKKFRLNIRVNIDKSNSQEYDILKEFLAKRYPDKNYNIYSAWTRYDQDHKNCNLCYSQKEITDLAINTYRKEKKKIMSFIPPNDFTICMARHANSYLIGPGGYVYKCWHDLGDYNLSIFNINNAKQQNIDLISRYMIGSDLTNQEKCKKCKMLPLCMAGYCVKNVFEEKYESKTKDHCSIFKENLETLLLQHFDIEESKKEIA